MGNKLGQPFNKTHSGEDIENTINFILGLEEILGNIKRYINFGIETKNIKVLSECQNTILKIVDMLISVDVSEDTPSLDKKKNLMKDIDSQYFKIYESIREIMGTQDINYLDKPTQNDMAPKKLDGITKSFHSSAEVANIEKIENFYYILESIQKITISSTYSAEEAATIVRILESFQYLIRQISQEITGNRGASSNLKTKLNYSTPNLSSSKACLKLKRSLSLDLTKQNVYDLSTLKIRDIRYQPVVLRNKQFYRNFEFEDRCCFSKIEEIKTQSNYIKEKFAESQQKQHLKNKLESYVEILEGYVHYQNQATANNAKIVLTDIQKMLKDMSHVQEVMNATAQRRIFIEDFYIESIPFLIHMRSLSSCKTSLNTDDPIETRISDIQEANPIETQISEIQKEIDEVKSQVAVFINSDTSDQYKKLEERLLLLYLRVNKLKIPKNNKLYQRKTDLGKDIQNCFMILDERTEEAGDLMGIEKELAGTSEIFGDIIC